MKTKFEEFLNEGKGYPISETELGAWYISEYNFDRIGNKHAHFHPINSAYYNNILSKDGKDYEITTFAEFKKVFNIPLGNNGLGQKLHQKENIQK